MNHQTLFLIIISLLILQFLWETWLNYLNARHFKDAIPPSLSDVYEEEQYAKSQAYKHSNYRFGLVTSTFSLLLTLAVLLFGGFEIIDQWVRSITESPIPMALLFFGLIFIGTDLLTLPFSYYHTFVIEERFGFNKTTPRLFFLDKLKGWILMAVIGGGILSAVILLYQLSGSWFWLYAWLLIAIFTVFMNLFYSKLIVPLFNKQTPLADGSLRDKIETYAATVGFELKNIFIIDGSKRSTKANAYFSGFGKEKRVTLFDTLVDDLEEEEIVAVLAHEVGHYKKNHILVNLAAAILTTGLTLFLLSLFINNPEFSLAIGVSQPSFHAAMVGFGLLYSPVSECTGLLMNYISRKFEYEADHYARSTYKA
ncbi:MAG: M48 family metallopeptidase, partial [Flavobacteriaceae bacterium]|nr:M48 family metallopeptidase [Flavobacteriaceae bacterium]